MEQVKALHSKADVVAHRVLLLPQPFISTAIQRAFEAQVFMGRQNTDN